MGPGKIFTRRNWLLFLPESRVPLAQEAPQPPPGAQRRPGVPGCPRPPPTRFSDSSTAGRRQPALFWLPCIRPAIRERLALWGNAGFVKDRGEFQGSPKLKNVRAVSSASSVSEPRSAPLTQSRPLGASPRPPPPSSRGLRQIRMKRPENVL